MTRPARVLIDRFAERGAQPALVWRDEVYAYDDLATRCATWAAALERRAAPGASAIVGLDADYSPNAVALLLALIARGTTVALVSEGLSTEKPALYRIAEVDTEIVVDAADDVRFATVGHAVEHPLLRSLRTKGTPGLILFSSGSTGANKAVVHDADRLLAKYLTPRRAKVTIPFMLFDHIGGLNTVLHTLSSGGTAVIAPDRRPETICRLVAAHGVEVLPTSPTFINLLLLRGFDPSDLASLETVAYGAERMAAPTLARLQAALPQVRLVQSYGLSEVGILRTRSESSGSLWVELGGDGYETRVRDGQLQIKAEIAMLGYLNETSPFTDDGWLKTGDRVEVRDGYFKILGRASDLIIVGGEKVYPAEVEDHLLRLPGVLDAVVRGEPNAITGRMVVAKVQLADGETRRAFRQRMRDALSGRLAEFKIPQRVEVADGPLVNARFKRIK